jgi:histidine triad (HIT) family protein
MNCLFCKIANNELKSDTVYEDGSVKVFKDIHPKAPVHLLVIPKEHIQSVIHLEADHTEIIAKLIYAAKDVANTQGLQGYKLVFNVGREGGQVVDHLHLHLLGGWKSAEEKNVNV